MEPNKADDGTKAELKKDVIPENPEPEKASKPSAAERLAQLRLDISREPERKAERALHRYCWSRPDDKQPVVVKCAYCEKPFRQGSFNYKRNHRNYCSRECYLNASSPNRVRVPVVPGSSRRARKTLGKFFNLQPEHVVHFFDRNPKNYHLRNLMVFRNRKEFTRWNRYRDERKNIQPLFDGGRMWSLLEEKKPKSEWSLFLAA